ncbi:endonuclease [Pectobacterium phage POP12]|nr:endonuclease [Pectobacterium phage POP12]
MDQEKKINRGFVKQGEVSFCVYSIFIDDRLVYIGKCRDLWKRLDTYRNSKYWKDANPSNVLKTARIEYALRKHKTVELRIIESSETDYHQLEADLVLRFSPEWNQKICLQQIN